HPQHLERRDALSVGWQLPYAVPLEGHGNRLDPLGAMVAEMRDGEVAAELLPARHDALPQLASVQSGRTLRRDQAEALGQVVVREPFARVGSAGALDQERGSRTLVSREPRRFAGPVL